MAGRSRPRVARGTIAWSNPSRAASRRRRSTPPDRPQLAEQPDFADRHRPRARPAGRGATKPGRAPGAGRGPARSPRGHRRGSRTRRATPGRSPRAVRARRRAARAGRYRDPTSCAAASRNPEGDTSAWTSTSNGRLPSRVGATMLPGAGPSCSARNARAGSASSSQPRLAHLEDADLLGRPEAVLGRPQDAQRARPLAVEREDDVDQMLERLGPGQRPVLRHVPDEHDRKPSPFASSISRSVDLADLPHAPRPRRRARRRRRLHEFTTTSAGRHLRGVRDAPSDIGGGHDPDPPPATSSSSPAVRRAGGFGRRLLARGVQDAADVADPASPAAAWSRSVDLPIPGSPPSRTTEPVDQPAAQDPVELADPDRPARRRRRHHDRPAAIGLGTRRGHSPARSRGRARLADDGLDERVPRFARAALALPAKESSPHAWQT